MEQTLILPISGGFMINQLAIITKLRQKSYTPSIILGASGGSIASYFINAAGIDQPYETFLTNLMDLLSVIDKDYLYQTHPLAPSFFDRLFRYFGAPGRYLFGKHFPEELHQFNCNELPELWILGYLVKDQCPILWTNKEDYTLIPDSEVVIDLISNTHELEDAIRGSSAIPFYTDPYHVGGKEVIDGGFIAPSPLRYFVGNYRERIPLRLIYVSPIDQSFNKIVPTNPFFSFAAKKTSESINTDLVIMKRIIEKLSGGKYKTEEGLLDDLSLDIECTGSIIYIYPLQPIEVNPFHVEAGTLNLILKECLTQQFRYKRWYY